MSSQSEPETSRLDLSLILIATTLILGVFWFFMSNSQQVLRNSPLGLDGLQAWIASDGRPIRVFSGGWQQDSNRIGLRVLPIHDTDPGKVRESPTSKQEFLAQSDEYDIRSDLVADKAALVPTLVVLPKWRSGLRLTGLGHPALLIENGKAGKVLSEAFPSEDFQSRYVLKSFSDFEFEALGGPMVAKLYVAQVFSNPNCEPILGNREGMVLGKCSIKKAFGGSLYVLSDPDLLNNHGLRLGENAHIMRNFLVEKAGEHMILIDYSKGIWLFPHEDTITRERTWSDMLQFFAYPFSLLWGSAALLMFLILWRAGVRYGPILTAPQGHGAGKEVANSARARLMRLTGQDGALLRDYAEARLAGIAAKYLGPHEAGRPDAALRFIERKRPDLAVDLNDAFSALTPLPAHLPANAAIVYVDKIEHILEQFEHDT